MTWLTLVLLAGFLAFTAIGFVEYKAFESLAWWECDRASLILLCATTPLIASGFVVATSGLWVVPLLLAIGHLLGVFAAAYRVFEEVK